MDYNDFLLRQRIAQNVRFRNDKSISYSVTTFVMQSIYTYRAVS